MTSPPSAAGRSIGDGIARARQLAMKMSGGGLSYLMGVVVRAGARGGWSLFVPVMLTVTSYGRYSLYATAAAMLAQLALLGAPQTIVRSATARLPLGGLLLHSLALSLVALAAFVLIDRDGVNALHGLAWLGALAIALYSILLARAKALFDFAGSLRAELVGAASLVACGVAWWTWLRTCGEAACGEPWMALAIDLVAPLATAGALLAFAKSRPSRRAFGTRGTTTFLPPVYSVGFLVVLEIVFWRRVEIYFLQYSSAGLTGVAVFNVAAQLGTLFLLLPTALLDVWQPKVAVLHRDGDEAALWSYLRDRRRQWIAVVAAVTVLGAVATLAAIELALPRYAAWRWYITAFVVIRLLCAGASYCSSVLYAVAQERRLFVTGIVGCVVSLCANSTLTLRFGLDGGVAAYACTQLVVALTTLWAFRAYRRLPPSSA